MVDKGIDNPNDRNYNPTSLEKGKKNAIVGIPCYPGLEFRSKVVFTTCQHCNHTGQTDVQAFWSVKNYLCCYYCGWYWRCMQLIRGKQFDLRDATHKCQKCQKVISNYEAC